MSNNTSNTGIEFKYLIVNDTDRRFGLWVNTVGVQRIAPDSPYPLRTHPSGYYFNASKGRVLNEFQLIYITDGYGRFDSESERNRTVCAGRLMMVFPGRWHTYRPFPNVGWNEYYIGFDGPMAESIMKAGFIDEEQPVVDIGLNDELVTLYTRAIQLAEADGVAVQQHLAGIVVHMLGLVIKLARSRRAETSAIARKIEQAKIYMKQHVADNINTEQMADELNISYSWFRKAFREQTGYAPAKYFHELRIQRARQLLADTAMPAKEVAAALGYSSAEHFHSMFKKATGQTPNEYRQSSRPGDDSRPNDVGE